MSLILDALKKLDREKSSRCDGNANIAAGILQPAPPRPGRKNRFYFAALSLSALAAAGVTYAVLEYGSPRKTQTTLPGPAAAQSPPPATRQASVALPAREPAPEVRADANRAPEKDQTPVERKAQPVSPALRPKTASPPAAGAAVAPSPPRVANPPPSPEQAPPARNPREAPSVGSNESRGAALKNPSPPETKAASPPAEKAPARKAAPEGPAAVPAAPIRPADAAPAAPAGDPPPLKLSGIVWHEDPAARRAVVNGTFAAEGSIVEGVKVVEIHPNRVAFSHNGRSFEIVMFR